MTRQASVENLYRPHSLGNVTWVLNSAFILLGLNPDRSDLYTGGLDCGSRRRNRLPPFASFEV